MHLNPVHSQNVGNSRRVV